MKKIKWSLLLFLFPIMIFSQGKIITGKVTDDAGLPLPGVTILVTGTNKGVVSNFDGDYQLETGNLKSGNLEFRYLGYATKNVAFNDKSTTINVALSESQDQLDEIVVTALGIKREKKSLVYATQSVSTEGMTEARSTNFVNALSGTAAGVQVVNAGTPTGSSRIVIRGLTSVTGDNQPLYVIDGIPLGTPQGDGGVSVWNGGDDIDYGNPISQINPDDIESLEVLKGPNAAALYGSRASNGVIIITTKKGKTNNNLGVTINSNTSFISNREYPYYQYVYGTGDNQRLVTNANRIDAATGLPSVGAGYTRSYGAPMLGQDILTYNGTVSSYLPNINNVKELYQVGTVSTNSVAIEKGGDKGSFRLAYANTSGEHVIQNSEVQNRNNLTFRGLQNITDKFSADLSLMYTNATVKNRLYQNGSERNPANNYMYIRPDMSRENLFPYKTEAGEAFRYNGPFNNPYWNVYENSNEDESNRLIGSITLNWEILEGLSLRTKVNGDVNTVIAEEFNNMGAAYDLDGYYRAYDNQTQNWNYEAILNYTKKFNDFSLVSLVGTNRFDLTRSQRDTRISSLLIRDVKSLSNSNAIPDVRELDNSKRINSVFGSLSLGYKDTYYFDATARNDWSSTLPANNNSYFYPSFGGSVIFSEWLPNNKFLTFGKLRASYAQVGNDTDPYRVLTTYDYGGNYNSTSWLALQSRRNNPDIKPELTSSTEFGLEARLFDNRISLNATYYKSSTLNQIIPAQTSATTGFSSQIFNAGEIQSKGFEVFMSAKVIDNTFKWNMDVNWAQNESKVISLIDGVDRLLLRNWFNVSVYASVGNPLGEIRGDVQARDPETGIPLVLANGLAARNQDEYIGNAQPDWIGGIRNSFSYKAFSFNFLVDVKIGGDVYSGTMLKAMNFGVHGATYPYRDDFFFSSVILGENNNELQGVGLFGNDYADHERRKGQQYEGAAVATQDADGNYVAQRDTEGNIIYSDVWVNPQPWGYDALNNQELITYDASYVKLREVAFGYTFPNKLLKGTPLQRAKISLVGRDLWTIYRNTPQGIDPEAGTTSGNGQGIEYGSFLPTRTVGLNINLAF